MCLVWAETVMVHTPFLGVSSEAVYCGGYPWTARLISKVIHYSLSGLPPMVLPFPQRTPPPAHRLMQLFWLSGSHLSIATAVRFHAALDNKTQW